MKYSLKWCAVLVAASVMAVTAFGAEPETASSTKPAAAAAKAAETKPKRDTYPLYGEVVSINASSLVIKGGVDKPNRTFVIGKETEIVNDQKAAKASDVKPGHWVGGLVKKTEKGDDEVLKINVGVKQKEAKAPEAKAPEAKTTEKKKP